MMPCRSSPPAVTSHSSPKWTDEPIADGFGEVVRGGVGVGFRCRAESAPGVSYCRSFVSALTFGTLSSTFSRPSSFPIPRRPKDWVACATPKAHSPRRSIPSPHGLDILDAKRGIFSGAHEGRGEEAGRSHPLLMPPASQRDVAHCGLLSHSRGRPSVDGALTDRRDTPGGRERGSEREKGCPLKGGEVVPLAPGKEPPVDSPPSRWCR